PAERLQDNPGGVESIVPYLCRYRVQRANEQTLMELRGEDFVPAPVGDPWRVRRATLDDLSALVALYAGAGDMRRTPPAVERPLRDRRVWLAHNAEGVCAAALTNAETESAAMIGGVFTRPEFRGQGMSRAVTGALC